MNIADPFLDDNDALWLTRHSWKGKNPKNIVQIHKTLILAQLVSLKDTGDKLFNNTIMATSLGPRIDNLDIFLGLALSDPKDSCLGEFLELIAEFIPSEQTQLESFLQGPESLWAKFKHPCRVVDIPLDSLFEAINNPNSEESMIVEQVMKRMKECDEALDERLAQIPIPQTGPLVIKFN